MTKSFTLQPLVNLAQQRNDAATRHLGQLNQQQQSAQTKLAALLQYRKDYQDKFQLSAKSGMDPSELRNFQQFIYRLDEAIAQQRLITAKAERSVELGRHELKQAQIKMKSFDTLAQRQVEREKTQEAKTEQKLMDEHANRRSTLRGTESEQE